MSVIVPCLYNSYSFTKENLEDGRSIIYYEREKPVRVKEVPEPLFTTPMPVVIENEKRTYTKSGDESGSGSESESESESGSASGSESESASASASDHPEEQFHPDLMNPYRYGSTGSRGNEAMKKDALLWCIYIMIYGLEKYETIENYYTESNRFKFELIELLRENKPKLKANKLKLSGIEESLVHKPFITLETFHGIAVCKSLSVYIVQNRKYYDIVNAGNEAPFIVEKVGGQYILYIAQKQTIMIQYAAFIRANYWRMESISAPIRPISAYKLQDLIDISTKLGLPVSSITPGKFGSIGSEKRKTKPELYEAICRCL